MAYGVEFALDPRVDLCVAAKVLGDALEAKWEDDHENEYEWIQVFWASATVNISRRHNQGPVPEGKATLVLLRGKKRMEPVPLDLVGEVLRHLGVKEWVRLTMLAPNSR